MSQLINSFPIGTIFYQSGKGYPTHIATRGCTYIDVDTGTMYINKDGIVNWAEFAGNPFDYIHFNTGQTATYNGGDLFWVDRENALSYKPYTLNNDVTINLGQENVIRVYNNSGAQINNGQICIITGTTGEFSTVGLAIGYDGASTYIVDGVATHDIPNNTFGFITRFGHVNDINLSAFSNGEYLYLSQTTAGALARFEDLSFTGRVSQVGYVISAATNGILEVSIINEDYISDITALQRNILTANNSSTGLFSFSGISIASPTTFNVGPVKGWIIDNITNPIDPTIQYIEFDGLTGQTTPYLNTNTITYILLTSGSTLTLQPTPPTSKQKRQNIYLGKLGHANLTTIIQAFNEPDIEEAPLSQVRDMFQSIRLINSGVYPSANGANLSFNTSSGLLYGFGINFINDNFTPNALSVSGQSPTTFQYRTQTGGTGTNVTVIEPNNYDNGGVITTVGGGTNRSTNQRIFLTQNGTIRVQYGQQIYNDLPEAIAATQTESFNTFSNFRDNAILIGILSVRHTATNLSDTNYARFLLVSKFGETVGSAGGISTTNLQQAYNNSTTPEITINSTLDGLSIKNGTGNADNVTNLLEGVNAAGNTTSFIRADGDISGTTLQTSSFTANTSGLAVSGTYGSANLNASNNQSILTFSGSGTIGGSGYTDFIKVTNTAAGATNINKTFRVNNTGGFEIVNSSYLGLILSVSDSGNLVAGGSITPQAWNAGQVIKDTILSNTEVTISTTTIGTSTSDTDFLTYSYTPVSSNSYLIIHYHLGDYTFDSGTGNDSYFSRIKVDGAEITYANQSTVNGFRSGVLFPLTGRYTNSNTTAKSIVVACRRESADDNITIANTATSMWLRITEIAR